MLPRNCRKLKNEFQVHANLRANLPYDLNRVHFVEINWVLITVLTTSQNHSSIFVLNYIRFIIPMNL